MLQSECNMFTTARAITPKKKKKKIGYLVCGCFQRVYTVLRNRKKAKMRDWEKMCLKGLCLPPPPSPPCLPACFMSRAGESRAGHNQPTFVNLLSETATISQREKRRAECTISSEGRRGIKKEKKKSSGEQRARASSSLFLRDEKSNFDILSTHCDQSFDAFCSLPIVKAAEVTRKQNALLSVLN